MKSNRPAILPARGRRTSLAAALAALLLAGAGPAAAQLGGSDHAAAQSVLPSLESLPRPATPPAERGPVVPARVERWRIEAEALEHGSATTERDAVRAAQLYCRAARYGDADAQYALAWMLTNSRGIERDEAQAAHLFAAAAEQGHAQAQSMAVRLGTPLGPPPACLRPPEPEPPVVARAAPPPARAAKPWRPEPPPPPANAPPQIVRFVTLLAPEYQLEPHVVLAVMATESNFDPLAVSPKNAQGLMQLIPDTARRFQVRNAMDPAQNIRGGMAYLRWLMAYFEGNLPLVLAAYNAGERAVERYRGIPPYAETRHYVFKILAGLNGQRMHPFDASVTAPSDVLALMREPLRPRR